MTVRRSQLGFTMIQIIVALISPPILFFRLGKDHFILRRRRGAERHFAFVQASSRPELLSRSHQRGFTLLETMVAIAVAAILLTIGIPSFRSIMQNSRAAAAASDLTSALNLARSEAVRRALPVQVCSSADETNCGGNWNDGWVVRLATGSDPPLRVWQPPADALIAGPSPVVFGALGQLTSANLATLTAEVTGCAGQRARRIEVVTTGRVSVNRVACQ